MLSCLVLAIASYACSSSSSNPTGPVEAQAGPLIASVAVVPGVATIGPAASLRFVAEVRDAQGRAVQAPVQWQATGGTIDLQGNYLAGTVPGEFQVRAQTAGELAGSARITISPATGAQGSMPASVYVVVGEAGSPNGAEKALRARLETLVGAVAFLDDDRVSNNSVTGCRLVVVSKTVTSTKVGNRLKPVSCGVLFWEDNLQKLDMMATIRNDGSSGTAWESRGQTLYVRSDAPSELRDGMAGSVAFYTGSGTITHSPSGEPLPAAAMVVAEMNQGSSRKAIYVYDKGRPLADGSAAAGRRVYFGLYDDSFDDLTPDGLRLFDAAARWAAGSSQTTTPTSPPPSSPPPSSPPPSEPAPSSPPPPTSGIEIRPGESIQSYVDRNPEGTAFVIKAGVHRQQSVEPKSGMTFTGEAGAVLDGDGTTSFAFGHYGPGSSNVTVKGLEIRNYRTKITEGAIQGDNTTSWTVEANDIHDNGGFGIRGGKGMRVLRNHTHHNGDAGIHGYRADGMLVEGNEVNNNGDSGVQSGALATAAGMKFFKIANLVVRNNYVHHNATRGIWTDTDCIDILIEGNRVVANGKFGIWHEISYRAVIRNNYVEGNGFAGYDGPGWLGGAGIAVTNSPDVEIYGNTLVGNADGIAGMQASGYVSSGAYGPYVLTNLYVHDNVVQMNQGRVGIVQNVSDNSVFTGRNNRFARNAYTLAGSGAWFAWSNTSVDPTKWRSYGQDVSGTFQY